MSPRPGADRCRRASGAPLSRPEAIALLSLLLAAAAANAQSPSSELNLENQALGSVPSARICEWPHRGSVNVLSLAHNGIRQVDADAFSCVRDSLKILILRHNDIESLHEAALNGLRRLQVLLLDDNRLVAIPSQQTLRPLESLHHLNLAHNRIESLAAHAFGPSARNLISLNLKGNPLAQVDAHSAFAPLAGLKTLILSQTKLSGRIEPLVGLNELRFLHLDRLANVSSLSPELCRESAKLSTLVLSSNRLERAPQFAPACESLLLVDLSHNRLAGALERETFKGQPNLVDLYLGYNQLDAIQEFAFAGLARLQVLELAGNQLKRIHPNAFLPLRLLELSVAHNPQLAELPGAGLEDQLVALKAHGTNSLRRLPRLRRARSLALTYAYHCCDYLEAAAATGSEPTGEAADARPLIARLAKYLAARVDCILGRDAGAEPDESRWPREQAADTSADELSELILWPRASAAAEMNLTTEIAPPRPEISRRRRRSGARTNGRLIDELVSAVKQIRSSHSVESGADAITGDGDRLAGAELITRPTSRHLDAAQLAAQRLAGRQDRTRRRSELAADSARIKCRPEPNAFLPCRDLFDTWWLRVGVWAVFLLAFGGNVIVVVVLSSVRPSSSSSALTSIMWLAHSKRHIDVPRFLVINLAIADLLMAVYLGLLAAVDLSTYGDFKLFAIKWQYSTGCKLAGFLGVLSSELSVFILAIITLERNYAITNAVHLNRRLSLQKAMIVMLLGYAFALTMALLPLNGVSDYRKFSVCLPLDIESNLSSQLYVVTLVGINTFSFVLLLGCYLRMYCAIRGSQAWNTNDLRIAKRMSILVLTDFLCWMPIIVVATASLFGYYLVGSAGLKVLTIFVLPLNSVANPFLYAITTKKFKRDLHLLTRRLRHFARRSSCLGGATADDHYNFGHKESKILAARCHVVAHRKSPEADQQQFTLRHKRPNRQPRAQHVTANQVTLNRTTCSCQRLYQQQRPVEHQMIVDTNSNVHLTNSARLQLFAAADSRPRIVLDSVDLSPPLPPPLGLTHEHSPSINSELSYHPDANAEHSLSRLVGAGSCLLTPVAPSTCRGLFLFDKQQEPRLSARPKSADDEPSRKPADGQLGPNMSCQAILVHKTPENLSQSHTESNQQIHEQSPGSYRSASACGYRDSRRDRKCAKQRVSRRIGSNKKVAGSCDNATKLLTAKSSLSHSISRLLFEPIAKAWSSIQISLGNNQANNPDERAADELEYQGFNVICSACSPESEHPDQLIGQISPGGAAVIDDILLMSSPERRPLRINERRMSRSCDLSSGRQQLNEVLPLQSPTSSGNETSHFDYHDDRRILLATINSIAAVRNSGALPAPTSQQFAPNQQVKVRGRCTRCRSWSPALLGKLEDCIYQIRNRLPGLSSSGRAGDATLRETGEHSLEQSDNQHEDTEDTELDREDPNNQCEDQNEGEIEHDGDLFDSMDGENWKKFQLRGRTKTRGLQRQQSSFNSDTLSIQTGRTIMTNMSVSFDSTTNIPRNLLQDTQRAGERVDEQLGANSLESRQS